MRSVVFCASLCLLGCSSDETGSGGGPGSPAASTGTLGAGGASTAVSSSVAASSSSGPCTMGGGGACPCPGDVCPVQLATGLAAASHLAESDTDLFYLASIDRVSKQGGAPAKLIGDTVAAFALDDTSLYWVDGSGTFLRKSALDGSGQGPLGAADGLPHAQFIAVDAESVYFASLSGTGATSCAGVKRLPKGGGPVVEVSEACSADVTPYGLGVDATSVYWITVVGPSASNGTIWKADKTAVDGAPTELAKGNDPASGLIVDATGVYWLQGSVLRVDPAGGMPEKVSGALDPTAFAVDGSTLYVLGGGLTSVDMTTSETKLLAYESGKDVVVDARAIYWLSGTQGAVSILKLAK